MTRSSKKELVEPYKELERVLHSTRKLYKTMSLDYSSSSKFELFSDHKLRENTLSGSDDEDENEHIKRVLEIVDLFTTPDVTQDQLMLRYPPARTVKRMEEINNFQQEADETLYQVWEQFQELLLRCPQHYLTNMHEVILFYKGLDVPTRQILDSKGDVPKMSIANVKKAIQEMAGHSQKWHDGSSTHNKSGNNSDGLAAIQA
ncbi:hypothetical protein Tco_0359404 [Tanacetum coccineum]